MDHETDASFELAANNTVESTNWARREMFIDNEYPTIAPIISYSMLIIGVFGVIGNILTLKVYAKAEFSETIHMSYIALAISDLGCVLSIMWVRLCFSTLVEHILIQYLVRVDMGLFSKFTGGWPNLGFSRTTALLTAWISLERCLCVLLPTKVKVIITPKVTKAMISFIYIIGCCPLAFAYVGFETEVTFDPVSNFTTLFMDYNQRTGLTSINKFAMFLYGAFYPLLSWILVTICSTFLIAKLKRSSRWRNVHSQELSGPSGNSKTGSGQRENRVTRTVVMIASSFIILSSPSAGSMIVSTIWRQFSMNGSLHFPFMLSMAIALLFSEINSSINIIVYAITGSRFRSALLQILKGLRTASP